jgi:hypothetical protein
VELEGNAVRFPPCREASKLDSFDREICRVDSGIPVVQSVYVHDPVKLPPQEKGTFWIVPKLMAELYRNERSDFVYPATNPRRDGAEIVDTKVKFVRYFRRPSTLEKR